LLGYTIYPSLWEVKSHWPDTVLLYAVTDQDVAFLVPDSCTGEKRKQHKHGRLNGQNKEMIRTTLMFVLFRQFGCCFGFFFLHCRINNVKFIWTRCETGQKNSPKARTNIFNISRKCTYIDYM
jgi:hypothetical protein